MQQAWSEKNFIALDKELCFSLINIAPYKREYPNTPQPLYNPIVGIHSINRVISKQKCIDYIEK